MDGSRSADVGDDQLLQDFRALRKEFQDEGLFEVSYAHVLYRFAELFALHILGVYLLLTVHWLPASIVLGVGAGRAGWLMHEAGHYSLTGNTNVDRHLQMFTYGFFDGMSAAYWRNQHNKHHAMPQKLEHDVDLNTLPLVAFNIAVAEKATGFTRRWLSVQHVLFMPFSTLLVTFGWMFYLHPRHSVRTKNYIELVYMAARYVLIAAFLVPDVGLVTTAKSFCASVWFGGIYIFGNFALSHTHKPVLQPHEDLDWVRLSANHTTNLAPSALCDWWMSYLNYQIEHHLFPTMPQFRHPHIAPRVRSFLEKHGLTYDVRPYWTGVADTLRNLYHVGNHAAKEA